MSAPKRHAVIGSIPLEALIKAQGYRLENEWLREPAHLADQFRR